MKSIFKLHLEPITSDLGFTNSSELPTLWIFPSAISSQLGTTFKIVHNARPISCDCYWRHLMQSLLTTFTARTAPLRSTHAMAGGISSHYLLTGLAFSFTPFSVLTHSIAAFVLYACFTTNIDVALLVNELTLPIIWLFLCSDHGPVPWGWMWGVLLK